MSSSLQIRILKREKENRDAAKQEQFSLSLGGHAPAPVITAVPADSKPMSASSLYYISGTSLLLCPKTAP